MLSNNGILQRNQGCLSNFNLALEQSLKTALKISVDSENSGYTYKAILITMSIYGFVVITHYEVYLGSALIVEKIEDTFKSWSDVAKSDAKILTWHGGITEAFKKSPSYLFQQIYQDKILNEKSLNEIGYERSIALILSGKYVVYFNADIYSRFKEYPCEIDFVKSLELR